MTLNILADENIPAVEHYLGAYGRVQRVNGRALERAQLQDVDVLLVRSVTRVDEALLSDTAVRFVGTATSGVDHIDRAYLGHLGIGFAYAPGSNANSVVEYVLSAIAAVGEKLERLFNGGDVGIVGYGNVGRTLAARLNALNITYRVYDPWLDKSAISQPATLEEVLDCDVVSLHPELTAERPWPSHHLLAQRDLQRLNTKALLINTSRGPVIDNAALLAHLERGRGPITVLDVWETEPNISASLLERVALGTPHIAGYSLDGKLRATRMLAEAAAVYLQLTPPPTNDPEGAAPAIRVSELMSEPLSETLSSAQLVRSLLLSRYDIRQDDALLRDAVLGGSPDHGAGFDYLRKTYRNRRELAGSTVESTFESAAHRALVHALDCVVVSPGNLR